MAQLKTISYPLALGILLTLAGCGGGGSSGGPVAAPAPGPSAPTPISAVGTIDGFGSVYVNGIEFETDSSSYSVDDEDAFDDSSLSVGMVVKVEGTISDDNSGTATSIHYDDELEGPVDNLVLDPDDTKTFTIFDMTVVAIDGSTVFRAEDDPNFDFDSLADLDHIEVSGMHNEGTLIASYIKKEDGLDDDFEAKGTVSGFNGSDQFVLTLRNGSTLNITLGLNPTIPAAGIMDGQFVEVEGTIPDPVGAPDDWTVKKVELEGLNDFDGDDDDVRIEDILNLDADGAWRIRDTVLAFAPSTEYRPADLENEIDNESADGMRVRVRGQFSDGMLTVERIRIEEDDLEIKGIVAAVAPDNATTTGTLTVSFNPAVGTIDVTVDDSTMFLNDHSLNPFDLSDLNPGTSFVEIKAHLDELGNVVAGSLELEDSLEEYEIEGPLDAITDTSVKVLNVEFTVEMGTTTLFPDGVPSTVGTIVDVEDFDRDGTADSVGIED